MSILQQDNIWNSILSWGKNFERSINEMIERAKAMGANAIVGIDIDYETIGAQGSMLMVATSGTAVVL